MIRPIRKFAGLCALALVLAGCENSGLAGSLREAGVGDTPDEFLVLPTRPLVVPQDLSALPPPTPGSANLVDYVPQHDAIAGLTGNSEPVKTANGSALVARVGGADPRVREKLAQEDAEYRSENGGLLFERMFSTDREELIYEDTLLDAGAEYQRLRARGLRQPAPPPSLSAPKE